MTKGSKEILERLRKLAKNYSCVRWDETGDHYIEANQNRNNVLLEATLALLDRFEDVEKNLTLGGFIQDTNGYLCSHGDAVSYTVNTGSTATKKGKLRWNPGEGAFLIDPDEGGNGYYLYEVSEWHKEA